MSGPRVAATDCAGEPAGRPEDLGPASARRWFLASLAVFGGTSVLGMAVAWLAFGSVPVALRYLRGERLIAQPRQLDAGTLSTTAPVIARAEIRNYTGHPVRLLGASYRCTCVVAGDLPATIPAGGSFPLTLKIQARPDKLTVDEPVVVFTDSRAAPRLVVRVRGEARQ